MKKRFVFGLVVCVSLTGITCAPQDDSVDSDVPPERSKSAPPKKQLTVADLPKVPEAYRKRIDAARETVLQWHPLTTHGFWTVFHYILGVGPDKAYLQVAGTRDLVKAIDYISEGKDMPGLVFRAMPDEAPWFGTVDVITLAGTGKGQGHQDQFVAEMCQWGLPKDHIFMVEGKQKKFADFIHHSFLNASLTKRQELSWAVMIIAEHYAKSGANVKWTNAYGEPMSLDDVVRYELEPISATTTCGGTHRLFDLTWAYFRHRERGGKKEGVWLDVANYLEKYKERAKELQNKDDFTFSTKYVFERGHDADVELRINTTGHVFEWLALYLSDAELREPWMQDAAMALATMLINNAHRKPDGGTLYHASHALEIYRTRVFGADSKHPPVIPPQPKD